jgi:hypothetical protein
LDHATKNTATFLLRKSKPPNLFLENELEIEVDVLQNDRRRVTRRFKLKKDGNAADVVFSAFGDDDRLDAVLPGLADKYWLVDVVEIRTVP